MNFTLILDNWYKRIAGILVVSALGTGLGWLVISGFVIRSVADQRWTLPREWLVVALDRFPNSARINIRLAEAEINTDLRNARFDLAENHATRAVDLSPWNFQARRLLATAQELNGKPDDAETSMREAVKLAPYHAVLNWGFANLLARRGKLEESLHPFRLASRSEADFLPSAVEMIWRFSSGDLGILKTFAGNDTESLLAVVKFLIEQNQIEEAGAVYDSIDREARLRSPQSREMIAALMKAGEFNLARATWLELITAFNRGGKTSEMGPMGQIGQPAQITQTTQTTQTTQPAQMAQSVKAESSLVWNGGFEADAVKGLDQFDWTIRGNTYARIGIDRNFARTGSRSLRVVFSGLDTTTLRDQVQQAVILKPGVNYRLVCYAKAKHLVTPEGPRIAIIGQNGMIGLSEPVKTDSSDWQPMVVDFTSPANSQSANSQLAIVAIVRTPRFSYDDPTSGSIWFDDFGLVKR